MAIKLEYVKVANYTKQTDCPHNKELICTVKNCNRCGWNPKVAEIRLAKIKKELQKNG